MRVLVVGSGGREHALVWKLSQDTGVERIICCPGNPGIAELATCRPVEVDDAAGLLAVCNKDPVDLVVFGPEEPLVRGVADALRDEGVTVFGPSRAAAQLEGSKSAAKLFMERQGIPTAPFEIFDSYEDAIEHVRGARGPVVVKADGLARGKGVMVCEEREQAEKALREIMVERRLGTAGDRVVVEECLEGEEVSVMAICDGRDYVLLPCSRDHKRAFDNDRGPNTGGMGAYCPVPFLQKETLDAVESTVIRRVVEGMASEQNAYAGILYAGLMLTAAGPMVLEFNCRLGDPEAQAVLPVSQLEMGKTLLAAAEGRLGRRERLEASSCCVCVVACSGGYPDAYQVGKEITGLETLKLVDDVLVFHAGTKREGARLVTAGGRVLDVVGRTQSMKGAVEKTYEALGGLAFEGIHYRKDIGATALGRRRTG